jgi:hypothetical protein
LTEERWRQLGPGCADINTFLRSVDFSAFNVQDKRPELVRRIKELQPEASNRAIAEAIGVGHQSVMRDLNPGPDGPPEARQAPQDARTDEVDGPHGPAVPEPDTEVDEEGEEVADEAEEELPAFLGGDGWTTRERAHAYAVYLGLPAALQPTVEALLQQPGICVADRFLENKKS